MISNVYCGDGIRKSQQVHVISVIPALKYNHSCSQISGILCTRHKARPSTSNFFFFLIHNSGKKRVLFPQLKKCCLGAKSYLTLLNPMDCSQPGSSICGLSQERKLEWVAISFSRGIFLAQGLNLCLLHWQAGSLPLSHLGSLLKRCYR